MKIVFAHTDFRLYWPARLAALRAHLATRGDELRVVEIAGKGSPYAFAGGSASSGDWWRCLFPDEAMEQIDARRAGDALFRALDESDLEVVFAGAVAFPSGATALRWARRRKRKVVIFDDARLSDVPRNGLVNAVKRRLFANADAWLVPSPSRVADCASWGVPAERLFFGVDCVDNAFFAQRSDAARADAARWRAELKLPERFVLGVGRQVEKKNWARLLEAWRGAMASGDCSLVLVGNGPERARLESLAAPNVLFRDFVAPEKLAAYYGLAAALVLPSSFGETWGLVVNEAMASGLPVLVSRQCGCCDTLVEDGGNGWTFDAADTAQIGAALRRFAGTPTTELARMANRSREIVAAWGLERFCRGVSDAIGYVRGIPGRSASLTDRVLLGLWKGRYRPT